MATLRQSANVRLFGLKPYTANATNNQLTCINHNYILGEELSNYTQSQDPPAPLSTASTYFAIPIDANHLQLATSYDNALAGTAIDITDSGSGKHAVSRDIYTNEDFYEELFAEALLKIVYGYQTGTLTLVQINTGIGDKICTDNQVKEFCSRVKQSPRQMADKMLWGFSNHSNVAARFVFSTEADIEVAANALIKQEAASY